MQELLFLDRLDGSREIKDDQLRYLHYQLWRMSLKDIAPDIKDGKLRLNFNFNKIYAQEDIPPHLKEVLIQGFQIDHNSARAAYIVAEYRENQGDNYLFSQPLVQALSHCKTNLPVSLFQKEFFGYLELPGLIDDIDGSKIHGTFVACRLIGSFWIINICSVTSLNGLYSCRVFYYQMREDVPVASMEDLVNRVASHESKKTNEHYKDYKSGITDRTIINAIAYILSNSEELKAEVNTFASKKSKAEGQQRVYTAKPYISLGRDFTFVKMQTVENTWVEPFYRWQPCGEGRASVKLTLVRGHERHYKIGLSGGGNKDD